MTNQRPIHMVEPTSTTFLCTANGVEVPSVIAGPFAGNTYDCAQHIEHAARAYATEVPDQDNILLFSLTVRIDALPEFEYVGFVDQFVAEEDVNE